MPRPMTCLPFSLSLETSGEKSESPETMTKVSTWGLLQARSIASTTRRMSAEFLPVWLRLRDLDQLDRRLVEGGRIRLIPAPVGIGFLDDQLALLDQSFEHFL